MAGIGNTTLAIQVAHRLADRFLLCVTVCRFSLGKYADGQHTGRRMPDGS